MDVRVVLCRSALVVPLLFAILNAGAASPAYAPPPSSKTGGIWSAAPDMHSPRVFHMATRLLDGRVLVAGGRTGCCSPALTSAELFDPVTSTWAPAASMPLAVLGVSVLLQDGRVMIMGGAEHSPGPVVVLYDPATDAWTTAPGPGAGSCCTLSLLSSGKVLVAGGVSADALGAADTALLFDPATLSWSETGRLNDKRIGAKATLLRDGRVLIFAGVLPTADPENPLPVTTAELYDPLTGQWTRTTSPNRIYVTPEALSLPDGRVLVLGDVGDTELYDPVTARWTISGTRQGAGLGYAFAPLATGQVLVAGGVDIRLSQPTLAGVDLYDPRDGTWSATAPLPTPRFRATATTLLDGRVLVTGGQSSDPNQSTAFAKTELYQPAFVIGPGLTGMWYDPAQSGHGVLVEVLPGQRLLAAWLTFDPAGNPAWFLGTGDYSGNTATISAVDQPSGGRWIPNFDPGRIVHHAWGTLTLTFSDCNHGVVRFDSTAPGYGSGSMDLTRLTSPAGTTCP